MNTVQQYTENNRTTILSESYIFTKKIGAGSFGEVYLAQHKSGIFVAAKVEERGHISRILNEFKIYKYLHKSGFNYGLPKIYEFIQTPYYNIMFMQLLGPSLEDLFIKYGRKFQLPTIFKLADQFLLLLNMLHNAHIIHRDIKPNNFLIGKENKDELYIMDFGLSKKYINGGKHIEFRNNRSLIGTARYASINMHLGFEPSRRDDLESIGYVLIYFFRGSLPWQGKNFRLKQEINKKDGMNNIDKIGEIKMCTSLDILCYGMPECFKEYLVYCRRLKFDETPDYDYLRSLFHKASIKLNIVPHYEWCY